MAKRNGPLGNGLPPDFLPRQEGESDYAFRNRKSKARYGKTEYERRIERGRARGLSVSESRGHGLSPSGQTEYQRRAEYTQQTYGMSPYELWKNSTTAQLNQLGYTPSNTGLSQNQLLTLGPKLIQMAEWASEDGKLSPEMIREAVDAEEEGELPPGWAYSEIEEKYSAMYFYKNNPRVWDPDKRKWRGDYRFGKARYLRNLGQAPVAAQWWYYH